jgi:plastocyanin
MSRTLPLAVAAAILLIVAACSGGTSTSSAPSVAAPSSEAPASDAAPSESAAASESAGGGAACAPSTTAGTVTGTIANFAFSPATITAKVGDTVTWTNNDTTAHTATLKSDASCDTGSLQAGAAGGIQFDVAGSYDYFCKIHPNMTGKVEVS